MRPFLILIVLLISTFVMKAQDTLVSDGSWKSSDYYQPGWEKNGFDDSQWKLSSSPSPGSGTSTCINWGMRRGQTMWSPGPLFTDTAYFRKYLTVPSGYNPNTAQLVVAADDDIIVYLNGKQVARDMDGKSGPALAIDVSSAMKKGVNVLAVKGINTSGSGGYRACLEMNYCIYRPIVRKDTSFCPGDTIFLDVTAPGAKYIWQDGSTKPTYTVRKPGKYWVITQFGQCQSTDSTTVRYDNQGWNPWPDDTSICAGDSILLDAWIAKGTGYRWQNGSTQTVQWVKTPGKYWVQASAGKCVYSDTTRLHFSTYKARMHDTTICEGGFVNWNVGTPFGRYFWQDGSTTAKYTATKAGKYKVMVTVGNCKFYDSAEIKVLSYMPGKLGKAKLLCPGETVSFDATYPGMDSYLWQDGTASPQFTATKAGLYKVTMKSGPCTFLDSVRVNMPYVLKRNFPEDTFLCPDEAMMLNVASDSTTYLWQDGNRNPVYVISKPGNYSVNLTNPCGSVKWSIHMEYADTDCFSFIPNVFSPNKDTLNQTFVPTFLCPPHAYELHIFNRWGEQIYTDHDYTKGWDGKIEGIPADEGVYLYEVKSRSACGKIHQRKGQLTLIR